MSIPEGYVNEGAPVPSGVTHQPQLTDTVGPSFRIPNLSGDGGGRLITKLLWQTFLLWKLPVLAFVIAIPSLAWISSRALTPLYEASASLRLDGIDLDLTQRRTNDAFTRIDPVALETQVRSITASEVVAAAARQTGIRYFAEFNSAMFPRDNSAELSAEEREVLLLRSLAEAVTVNQVGGSGVAIVSVRSQDPILAAHTANAVAENFIKHQASRARARLMGAIDTLVAQQSELERQLGEREREIVQIQKEHRLTAPDAPQSTPLLASLQELLIRTQADLQFQEALAERVTGLSQANKEIAFSPLVQELRAERARLLMELAGKAEGPLHPRMAFAKERLAEIDAIIDQEVSRLTSATRTEAAALRRRVESLRSEIEGAEAQLLRNAGANIRLSGLVTESRFLRESVETLKTQVRAISASLGAQYTGIDFVSRAVPPADPVFPRKKIIVVAAFVVACGLAGVFLLAAMHWDIRMPGHRRDWWQRRTEYRIVGALPLQKSAALALADAGSPYMRSLKRIVDKLGLQHGVMTTVAVYPVSAGGGASTFVRAMGLSCGRLEYKTLLVDLSVGGDLLAKHLESREKVGEGDAVTASAACRFDTENLHFLHHPPDRWDGDVRDVIGRVAGGFDLIIFDCPELMPAGRALEVAQVADHSIIVATAAEMHRIRDVMLFLPEFPSPPIIVLNRVDMGDFIHMAA